MKIYFGQKPFQLLHIIILLISLSPLTSKYNSLNAEFLFDELQIDSSTKTDDDSAIPTNPFEIVEMIRRYNSLNDATRPSDALDDAIRSFNNLEEKQEFK